MEAKFMNNYRKVWYIDKRFCTSWKVSNKKDRASLVSCSRQQDARSFHSALPMQRTTIEGDTNPRAYAG